MSFDVDAAAARLSTRDVRGAPLWLLEAHVQALDVIRSLEQVGWYTPGAVRGVDVGSIEDGPMTDHDEPVYRLSASVRPDREPPTTSGGPASVTGTNAVEEP